jgi:uncharacterized phiE125 gp8 family phage protein
MGVVVITPPTVPPVSLDETKRHLRVEHGDDDAYITSLILVVTGHIDGPAGWLGRALVNQTLELRTDAFPCDEIALPYPPVVSLSSVKYTDADGVEQTVDVGDYVLVGAPRGKIVLGYGEAWPSARWQHEAVRVRYVAGYGAAGSDVPAPIRHALLVSLTELYENRGDAGGSFTLPPAAERLLAPYRVIF